MPEYLSIGKVSLETGCHVETIRYYEKEGLVPAPRRSEGGHRLYSRELVHRLNFVRRSRELGFSMEEIRQLLAIVDGDHVSCEKVKTIADTHIQDIQSKILDLKKMEATLVDLSNQCSGMDAPECPIVEALQRKL